MYIILVTFGCAGYSLLCKLFCSYGEQGLLYGMQASHCSGFSCCGALSLGYMDFSSCSSQAPEHRLKSCGACLALVALLHMGSFRIRDQTHVSPALSRRFFTTGPPRKSQEAASCWGLICISLETNDVEVFSGTYLSLKSFQQSFCSNLAYYC